jgi:hypothetical protein
MRWLNELLKAKINMILNEKYELAKTNYNLQKKNDILFLSHEKIRKL